MLNLISLFGRNKGESGIEEASDEFGPEAPRSAAISGPPLARSVPALSSDETEVRREWLALSKSLGIGVGQTRTIELIEFLDSEGIAIYPAQGVFDYLTTESDAAGTVWKFHPMRDVDAVRWPAKSSTIWASVSAWPTNHGGIDKQYMEKIPIPVLLTAKKISDKFGSEVGFLVAAIDKDPFLAVSLGQSSIVFVERWDEPGYRR